MALRTGLNKSLGLAEEVTWGTYVAPTRHLPLVEESLTDGLDIERIESAGVIAGRRVLDSDQWAPGNVAIEGDVGLELYDRSIGVWLKHMFGSVVTSGVGPFTHTYTPGDLSAKSLTLQFGMPNTVDGTPHPFSFLGCKMPEWELACAAGEAATLGATVSAKQVTTAQALVAPSYATGIGLGMTFIGASCTIAGSAYKAMEASLSGNNGLNTDRRFWSTDGTIDEQLEAALREYTGTVSSEFFGLTAYDRFVNGTTAALVYHFQRGASTLDITMNVRFDGSGPQDNGTDVVLQDLPFKCIGDTDAAAITAVLVNGDATP